MQEGVFAGGVEHAQGIVEDTHDLARRSRGVEDGLRYLFGRLERARHVDAGLAGLEGLELVGFAKAVLV